MIKDFRFNGTYQSARNMTRCIGISVPFIRKNKLWMGFLEHKWIGVFMICISALFSYYILVSWGFFGGGLADPIIVDDVKLNDSIPEAARKEGKRAFFSGGRKYLLLILFEVIIFHFSVRTFDILSGQKRLTKFADFLRAEKRMIVVMIYTFIKGLVIHGVVYIIFSILGYSSWTGFVMFFIYAYFLGYAFLDNYNEQFDKTIKESESIIRQHFWSSMVLGILASGLLIVPFFGPLVTPIFCSIAATIYGHKYIELTQSTYVID